MLWSFIRQFSFDSGSIRLLIAIIISIILLTVLYIHFSDFVPFYAYPAIFIFVTISTIFLSHSKSPSNATLTCKNGHTHRAWVNLNPHGFVRNYLKGGITFHVNGEPIIRPERCPECGARWEVPHKHKKQNTSDHYGNMK
jgi:hypothetical protein